MVPRTPVRHRARRPAARLPAGRPRHHDRGAVRRPAAQGALGRGLVEPAAPDEWLTYAALDVELLVELRDALAAQLVEQPASGSGRSRSSRRWWPGPACPPSPGPTRGGARPGSTRCGPGAGSRYVAELWYARDEIARRLDRAPGKILPDARDQRAGRARHSPAGPRCGRCRRSPRRQAKRFEPNWLPRSRRAAARAETELPPLHLPSDGPPQARLWAAKDPGAAARLARRPRGAGATRRASWTCRWRTCSPPTTSAGSPGRRPPSSPRSRRRRAAPPAPGPGSVTDGRRR